MREVFSGRCSFSTSSISSSLLRRSRSLRLIPIRNQPNRQTARGDDLTPKLRRSHPSQNPLGNYERITFLTTLRESFSSRQICLIGLCCTKYARRIFATVSTTNILREPPVPSAGGSLDEVSWGSRLDADHPGNGVLIPRLITKRVALILRAAVATTVRTSASPWAAHIARSPFVTLRWITAGRRSRSQTCSSRPPCPRKPEGQELVARPLHPILECPGEVAGGGCLQDGSRGPAPARTVCGPGSRLPVRSARGPTRRPCRATTGAARGSGPRPPRPRRPVGRAIM